LAIVTSVEKQKRKPRADVYLDGVQMLSLRLDVVVMMGVAVGVELDDKRRREIEAEDQRLGAMEAALRLFAAGPRSERDLRDRLKRRGFRVAAVNAVVDRMRELGYINDAAYARTFVESRLASTPRSRRALAFEMGRKGVDRELAATAIAELSDIDAAYDAAQRRLRAFRNLDREAFTRRMGNFLASRGFGYGVARATTERCYRELHDDEALDDASS
jgi:regulatory protein